MGSAQVELLGKLMLYDKELSVNRNETCAFSHMPEAGFTGPVSELNRTTGSYPGSVRTRFSERKPQSHAYAPLAPVLHYNPGQGDLVGGNFWDMRATGRRLGNWARSLMVRLPQQYAPLVYGIIQAAITAAVATGIATHQLTDFNMRFVQDWLFAWGIAFLTMLPLVIFVSPFIQRCVLALTISAADNGLN
jgi:hypothetical protein